MAKKKGKIIDASSMVEAHITSTDVAQVLEENYMPYTMSVIVSRALPEIDGLKPSHRKLLYTMYKMGLLKGNKTKSANIVGTTMRLNPHGDGPIYQTMVRLGRGNESLLHPYVDSKGNFGKVYSKDQSAASRYTEAKLEDIMEEFFRDIDKNAVDYVDNYDNSTKEPVILPVTFPSILANPNKGIAVGMASNICSFNLKELCSATIAIIEEGIGRKNPKVDTEMLMDILKAPDFPTGGYVVYNKEVFKQIYETGRGTFYLRAKHRYNKKHNRVEIYEIPYTTTVDEVIDNITDLVKENQIRELTDIRDATGKDGMVIHLDLKRNVDPEVLMDKLYLLTSLESNFSCNFNMIIKGSPRTLGIKEMLDEWVDFRIECIRRRENFELGKSQKRLHLLEGLSKVLLDLDKAVQIVKDTAKDKEVVNNLMKHFKIDEIQANYVAEIKLRNFNKEYLLNRTKDIKQTEKEIKRLEGIIKSETKIKRIIIKELEEVSQKYGKERKSQIVSEKKVKIENPDELLVDDYNVKIYLTEEGYIKKVPLTSLRGGGEHKLKEGDKIAQEIETTNKSDTLIFTDNYNVYKIKTYDLEDSKLSQMGDFIPNLLKLKDEAVVKIVNTLDYTGSILAYFENGKCARINMAGYETKTNRKQLKNAYSKSSKLIRMFYVEEDEDIDVILVSTIDKVLLANTQRININNLKTSQGVNIMKGAKSDKEFSVEGVYTPEEVEFEDMEYYRTKGRTAAVGKFKKPEDKIKGI